MQQNITFEIRGKDEFWERAFLIEWQDQFSERTLIRTESDRFIAHREWAADLERVAVQTFCRIVIAPENPQRRRWMTSLLSMSGDNH